MELYPNARVFSQPRSDSRDSLQVKHNLLSKGYPQSSSDSSDGSLDQDTFTSVPSPNTQFEFGLEWWKDHNFRGGAASSHIPPSYGDNFRVPTLPHRQRSDEELLLNSCQDLTKLYNHLEDKLSLAIVTDELRVIEEQYAKLSRDVLDKKTQATDLKVSKHFNEARSRDLEVTNIQLRGDKVYLSQLISQQALVIQDLRQQFAMQHAFFSHENMRLKDAIYNGQMFVNYLQQTFYHENRHLKYTICEGKKILNSLHQKIDEMSKKEELLKQEIKSLQENLAGVYRKLGSHSSQISSSTLASKSTQVSSPTFASKSTQVSSPTFACKSTQASSSIAFPNITNDTELRYFLKSNIKNLDMIPNNDGDYKLSLSVQLFKDLYKDVLKKDNSNITVTHHLKILHRKGYLAATTYYNIFDIGKIVRKDCYYRSLNFGSCSSRSPFPSDGNSDRLKKVLIKK
tara:strand:+ start:801 stop:2168 length:1368 start_codon:yes stop_codon:yes gene_type:complete